MQLTFPPQPFPAPPVLPPQPGPQAPLQPPMVYVAPVWEYKHLFRAVSGEAPPVSEEELNALGAEGWELTGVIPGPTGVHFYLKRALS